MNPMGYIHIIEDPEPCLITVGSMSIYEQEDRINSNWGIWDVYDPFWGISVVWATSMIYERSIPALPKMDQSEDVGGKTTRISPVYIVDIIYVIGDIIGDD